VRIRVAGTTYENRQAAVTECVPDEVLALVRDPANPYDMWAVEIRTLGGEMLGFVPREVASKVGRQLDLGWSFNAKVVGITGGGPVAYGLVIDISETRRE
jgi:hypothetical protein